MAKDNPLTTLKRTVAQRVRRMSVAQAQDWLSRYNAEWRVHGSISNPCIRELTNGFNSQSINTYVVRKVYDRTITGEKNVQNRQQV